MSATEPGGGGLCDCDGEAVVGTPAVIEHGSDLEMLPQSHHQLAGLPGLPPDTTPQAPGRGVRVILQWAALGAVVGTAVLFVTREARYFAIDPNSYGPYWQHRYFLLPHFAAGTVALLLGPVLLWTGMQRRYLRLHRWAGRLYLAAVGFCAATAYYLAAHSVVGWMLGVTLVTLASTLLATSAMGYVAIRRGQIQAHREWMTRSYVLTFSFVVVRLLLDTPFLEWADRHERVATMGWLGWTVPLVTTEFVLQWRRTVTPAARETSSGRVLTGDGIRCHRMADSECQGRPGATP